MRKLFAAAFLALALSATVVATPLLSGCQAIGVLPADSFEEKLLFVQSGVAAAQKALERKIDAGTISKRDATNTDAQLDAAVEGLDISITLREAGDPAAAGKLEATAAIVAALRTQLGV